MSQRARWRTRRRPRETSPVRYPPPARSPRTPARPRRRVAAVTPSRSRSRPVEEIEEIEDFDADQIATQPPSPSMAASQVPLATDIDLLNDSLREDTGEYTTPLRVRVANAEQIASANAERKEARAWHNRPSPLIRLRDNPLDSPRGIPPSPLALPSPTPPPPRPQSRSRSRSPLAAALTVRYPSPVRSSSPIALGTRGRHGYRISLSSARTPSSSRSSHTREASATSPRGNARLRPPRPPHRRRPHEAAENKGNAAVFRTRHAISLLSPSSDSDIIDITEERRQRPRQQQQQQRRGESAALEPNLQQRPSPAAHEEEDVFVPESSSDDEEEEKAERASITSRGPDVARLTRDRNIVIREGDAEFAEVIPSTPPASFLAARSTATAEAALATDAESKQGSIPHFSFPSSFSPLAVASSPERAEAATVLAPQFPLRPPPLQIIPPPPLFPRVPTRRRNPPNTREAHEEEEEKEEKKQQKESKYASGQASTTMPMVPSLGALLPGQRGFYWYDQYGDTNEKKTIAQWFQESLSIAITPDIRSRIEIGLQSPTLRQDGMLWGSIRADVAQGNNGDDDLVPFELRAFHFASSIADERVTGLSWNHVTNEDKEETLMNLDSMITFLEFVVRLVSGYVRFLDNSNNLALYSSTSIVESRYPLHVRMPCFCATPKGLAVVCRPDLQLQIQLVGVFAEYRRRCYNANTVAQKTRDMTPRERHASTFGTLINAKYPTRTAFEWASLCAEDVFVDLANSFVAIATHVVAHEWHIKRVHWPEFLGMWTRQVQEVARENVRVESMFMSPFSAAARPLLERITPAVTLIPTAIQNNCGLLLMPSAILATFNPRSSLPSSLSSSFSSLYSSSSSFWTIPLCSTFASYLVTSYVASPPTPPIPNTAGRRSDIRRLLSKPAVRTFVQRAPGIPELREDRDYSETTTAPEHYSNVTQRVNMLKGLLNKAQEYVDENKQLVIDNRNIYLFTYRLADLSPTILSDTLIANAGVMTRSSPLGRTSSVPPPAPPSSSSMRPTLTSPPRRSRREEKEREGKYEFKSAVTVTESKGTPSSPSSDVDIVSVTSSPWQLPADVVEQGTQLQRYLMGGTAADTTARSSSSALFESLILPPACRAWWYIVYTRKPYVLDALEICGGPFTLMDDRGNFICASPTDQTIIAWLKQCQMPPWSDDSQFLLVQLSDLYLVPLGISS